MNKRIEMENIDGQLFEIKIVDRESSKPASFTHYLHNHKNGVSKVYKKDPISHVKEILKKEYPTEKVTNKVAEEALQYSKDTTISTFLSIFQISLCVTLSGQAFRSNLFARSSQKGVPLQSLTQKLAA